MIRKSNAIIYALISVLVVFVLGMAVLGIIAAFYTSPSEISKVQIVVAGDQRLTFDVKYNKTLDISSIEEIEGYTFEGLYRDSIFTYKFDMNSPITKNVTLYAKYLPKLYTLTFYANDGTDDFQVLKRYYDTLTDLSELDFSDSPNNLGFKVAGFSEDPNATFATIYWSDMVFVQRDAAYYAVWRGTAQSVTFDTVGARTLSEENFLIEPTTVYLNTYYIVPDFSEVYNAANGATFRGFTKTGDTTIYTPGSKILITANTTLKMVFNSATNAVVLNYLDVANQRATYYGIGNTIALPDNLTKTNYELIGWSRYKREFREYAENEIIKLPGSVEVTSGTTQYYAVWAGQAKNVVFITNYAYKEGSTFSLNSIAVRYGEKLTIPSLSGVYSILTEDNPDPNYSGKSSIGKYAGFKLFENDRVYAPGAEIVIANDIILIMVFDGKEDSITLNYTDEITPDRKIVGLDKMLVLPSAFRENYNFVGWALTQKEFEDYDESEIISEGTTVTVTSGQRVYFAVWKKALFTVSHNTTGAINSLGQSVVIGEATVKNLEYYTIPMIEDCFNILNGSKYKGFRDAEGQIYEPNDEILITENTTLYIVFDGIENSTSFDYRNGQPNTKVYGIGLGYTLPVPNAKTRYEFLGWSTILKNYDDYSENEIYVAGQIIHLYEGLTIYYAIWRPVAIEFVFNANAVDASGSVANKIVRYTEKTNLPINLYVRSKHNFAGWSLYPDGSGTIYNAGATFTLNDTYFSLTQNGTLDFYAVWTIKTLTVTFNYNGGTPAEGGYYEKTVEYDSVFTLPNAQKTNRNFLGWSENINATSGEVSTYQAGAANITLHAIWQENIVLNINGGSGFQPFVEYNSTLTKFRLVNSYSNPGTSYNDVVSPVADSTDKEFYYYSTVSTDNQTKQEGIRYDLLMWYDIPDLSGKTSLYATYIAPTATFVGWSIYSGTTADYVVVPKGITETGIKKFLNNTNLKFVTLPQGLINIEMYAFSGATNLTGVSMPGDLKMIDTYAFSNCNGLTEFTVPTGVTSFGWSVFDGCSNLIKMTLPYLGFNGYLGSIFGADSYTSSASYVPASLKTVTLTSGGYALETGAFYGCSNITQINLPENLLSIGEDAFRNCRGLTKIELPNSITSIGNRAFFECSGLTEIINLEKLKIKEISGSMLSGCTSLTKIVIPNTVTGIDAYAFYGCSGLTEVTIPASVKSIGQSAFYNCTGLTEILVPNTVISIGQYAFQNCSNLSEITLPFVGYTVTGNQFLGYIFGASRYQDNAVYVPASLKIVTITGGQTLGAGAFYGCSNITEINLSSGLLSVGGSAFYGCSGLTEILIPNTVTSIGTYAFSGCTGLTEILLPNNLTSIGESSFRGCTGLTEILVPTAVTSIGIAAFQGCINLTDMTLPFVGTSRSITGEQAVFGAIFGQGSSGEAGTVSQQYVSGSSRYYYIPSSLRKIQITDALTLPYGAFYNCSFLTKVTINSGVTAISNYAFYNCLGITEAVGLANNTITSIGTYAFYNCKGLTEVTVPNSVTTINIRAFQNCSNLTRMTLPFVGSSATGNQFLGYIFGAGSYTNSASYVPASLKTVTVTGGQTLGTGAFYGCKDITQINLPAGLLTVGSTAFYGCSGLTEIVLPTGITSIGSSAFSGCTNLAEIVNLEKLNITSIPSGMLYNCSKITEITIQSSITSIGTNAFYGCTGLTEILVPNTVISIGGNAFQNCSNLTEITLPFVGNTAVASQFLGYIFGAGSYTNNATYVPASLKIVTVTGGQALGAGAFYGCSNITEINLPTTVTSIGSNAFYGCAGLTEILIPNTVTSIGTYAFSGCVGLTEILLPNSLTSIGGSAFYNCTGLTEILVPTEVTSIGIAAFQGCINLTEMTLPFVGTSRNITGQNAVFGAIFGSTTSNIVGTVYQQYMSGGGVTYYYYIPSSLRKIQITDATILPYGAFYGCGFLTEVTINPGVTAIPDYAFYNCLGITEAAGLANNTIKSIGGYAFYGCSGLTEVTVPTSVTTINISAFQNCINLTEITLPFVGYTATGNQFLGYIFGTGYYSSNATYVPASLKTVTVTGGQTLGTGAFYGCKDITQINLPAGLLTVGSTAFYGCSGLTEIVLPTGITSIGSSAFSGCTNLAEIVNLEKLNITSIPSGMLYNCSKITEITIQSSITSIGTNAFYGCTGLTEILIPNTVTSIGSSAFSGCIGLTEMTLPFVGNTATANQFIGYIFGTSSYTSNATYVPASLKTVTVTGGESLGLGAFYGCNNITEINLPSGLLIIGNSAFYSCTGLTEILIPNTVTSIGSSAFYYCTKIIEVVVPDAVTSIGGNAFQNCTNLMKITLPFVGNTTVANQFLGYIFGARIYSASASYVPATLKTVTITNGENLGNYAFYDCKNISQINLPANLLTIGNYAFYNCIGLTEIDLPASVTSIGERAFYSCTGLTDILVPSSVTSIGNYAFASCTSLTEITLPFLGQTKDNNQNLSWIFGSTSTVPQSLKNIIITGGEVIGDSAFRECSNITQIILPSGLLTIGGSAFYGCTGLTELIIPNTVTSIGNYAFSGCSGLTKIVLPTNITNIGTSTFYNCSGLTEIVIPNAVTSIGANVFRDCINLVDITLPFVGSTITENTYLSYLFGGNSYGHNSNMIPASLKTVTVTSGQAIANFSFYYCVNLTEINLPKTLISIGNYSFYKCTSLTEINLPEGLLNIGNYAFYNCIGLTEIELPQSLISIGTNAFKDCNALTELALPFIGETETTNQYLGYLFGATTYEDNATYVPASLIKIYVPFGYILPENALQGLSIEVVYNEE